ncbi:extracellular solute-binding protein [Pullulanibacillus sp. KACC 23026]|uniref:extracellular solute-binding protein n=1 Tax=Pullulanibacillus sp. KACC 23026 TaxID=3028315 RepID=UPI0023AF17A3|nr:extracellular solute-binding protein [Pullulanibacillus sp. KACC 23026]WEG14681.1 extracellular solute-binding protein [Pullulanibacillus sp. KACC 23026]
MKRFLKKSLVGAVTLTMAISLSACGGNSSASSGTTTNKSGGGGSGSSSGSKTITIAYQNYGSPPNYTQEWLNKAKTAFEKQHSGVTIKLEPISASENDFYTKIDLMMKSASTAPDIVTEDTFLINSDASAGYLAPLNKYVNSWSDWYEFSNAMKKGSTGADGNVYGVPYSTDTRGLWYNTEIFKKVGLPVPWTPKNWNDVLKAAKTIKAKDPSVEVPFYAQVGKATGEATSMQTFEMLLYGTNDTLYDNSTKKWIVKSQGFLDSLKFIQTLSQDKLNAPLSVLLTGQADQTMAQQLAPKGQVGIALDGNWIPGNWLPNGAAPWPDATKVMKLAAMPTQNGQDPGFTSLAGGWTLSISKLSQNKDLAAQFIELAVNKENDEWFDVHAGNLSPRTDVGKDPSYTNTPGQEYGAASSFVKFAHFRPANPEYPTVSTQIQAVVEAVATGAETPEQAMDQYAASVQRIVGASHTETK